MDNRKAQGRVARLRGGIWLYIDSETLESALQQAGMPVDAKLKLKRYPMTHKKGIAAVMILIKER